MSSKHFQDREDKEKEAERKKEEGRRRYEAEEQERKKRDREMQLQEREQFDNAVQTAKRYSSVIEEVITDYFATVEKRKVTVLYSPVAIGRYGSPTHDPACWLIDTIKVDDVENYVVKIRSDQVLVVGERYFQGERFVPNWEENRKKQEMLAKALKRATGLRAGYEVYYHGSVKGSMSGDIVPYGSTSSRMEFTEVS